MITAVALAGCGVLLFWPLPVLLSRAQWPARAPRAAVVLWQAIGLSACLAAVGSGLAVAVAPLDTDVVSGVGRMVRGVLTGHPLAGLGLYEALGLTLATDVTVVLVAGLVVTSLRTLRGRARHRLLLDLVAKRSPAVDGAEVLEHPHPLAYFLPGWRRRIVLSVGAIEVLAEDELHAVIAHERGHAHGRHDLVILPFASMVDLLRWIPYARLAPGAVATLLEMAADDFASRAHGRLTLARALVRLVEAGAGPAPACSFGVARGAVHQRVLRLLDERGNSFVLAGLGALGATVVLALPLIATAVTVPH